VTDTERLKTKRLVARSWQIKDLPLAIELWGNPAVTALIDSRGKLSDAQVKEKLRAEIERERSHGVQYWALLDHRNGGFVGCGGLRPWVYTPGEPNFEVGFHLVKWRCQVANRQDVDGRKQQLWRLCSRRRTGDVTPCAKGGIASRTMLIGAEVVTTELEMVVDPAVGGEETLRVTR
jgi:hypothetical protein